jgi:hypothetical protein
MSPRIIHIPLSGGDRMAQAKGIPAVSLSLKFSAVAAVSQACSPARLDL